MNTSAVNSPANLLQINTPNAPKQDAGSASDAGSFNQMLSREMSNSGANNNAASTQNANGVNNANASKQPASNEVKAPQKDDGNGESAKNDASASGKESTADATKKTDDDKVASGKDVKKDDKDVDQATAATDAAGIAAFVAALTSVKATPTETAVATAALPTDKKVLTDADIKTKNNTIDIAAKITSDATTGDQDAVGKKSDFVSALDKAASQAGNDDRTSADSGKSSGEGAKLEADITSANAQALKVLDAAGSTTPQTFANAIAAASAAIQPRNDAQQAVNSSLLQPQVGSADWNDALGQKMVWMVKGAEQVATLTLNPPDLGPMQVTVNVNNNQATASFVAHQPEVRHALEASLPRLREMLNEAGIQLGQSSVNAGTPNQQGSFGETHQGNGGSGRRAQSADAIESTVHVSRVPTPSAGSGMVDTFA